MKHLCLIVASLMLFVSSAFGIQEGKKGRDIVKSTHTVRGRFVGFEFGDYMHVRVKNSKGEELSFYLGGDGVDYFLANYPNKTGTFTVQTVDTYIPEAGGREVIEQMTAAKIGGKTSTSWWMALRKKTSMERIEAKYRPLIDKLTRK